MTHSKFIENLRQSKQLWHLIPCGERFILRTYNLKSLCPIQAVAADQQDGRIFSVQHSARFLGLQQPYTDSIIFGADDELTFNIVREDLLRSTGFRPIAHLA